MIEFDNETKDIIQSASWAVAHSMDDFEAFVYFITYEDGPIKIGKAKNVTARMKGLQTSHSQKLKVLGVIPGKLALEGELHRKFKHLRKTGEWFERTQELLDYIERHAQRLSLSLEIDAHAALRVKENDKLVATAASRVSRGDLLEIHYALRDRLIRGFTCELKRRHSDYLIQTLIASRSLLSILAEVNRMLSSRDVHLLNYHSIRKEIRRTVDDVFGTHWRMSDHLLSHEEVDREKVEHFSTEILRKNIAAWLGNHQEAHLLCDRLAGIEDAPEDEVES